MSDRTIAEVLNAAADLLERPGAWGQHDYNPHDGCYCINGAVLHVQGLDGHGDDLDEACLALARSIIGTAEPFMVARWNDAPAALKPKSFKPFVTPPRLREPRDDPRRLQIRPGRVRPVQRASRHLARRVGAVHPSLEPGGWEGAACCRG